MAKQRSTSKGADRAHGQARVQETKNKAAKGQGLIIFGCQTAAGKTVVMSALSRLLQDEGYQCATIKPIGIGNPSAFAAERSFITEISGYESPYEATCLATPGELTQDQWLRAVNTCMKTGMLTLVELPGGPATPLCWPDAERLFWKDCGDLATQLGWPCILVSTLGTRTVEELLLNTIYLKRRNIEVAGIVTVQRQPERTLSQLGMPASPAAPFPYGFETVLSERLRVPYLGCLPFSPSLCVLGQKRGNLIKLAEAHLDTFPLVQRLDLPLLPLAKSS